MRAASRMKFGFRMLVKYPGLTVVGGLAMAFGVWIGAVVFEMVTVFTHPTLPLPSIIAPPICEMTISLTACWALSRLEAVCPWEALPRWAREETM